MRKFTSLIAFFFAVTSWGNLMASDLYVVAKDADGNVVKEAKVNIESVLKFTGESVEVRNPQSVEATFPYETVSSISFRYSGAGVDNVYVTNNLRLRENPVESTLAPIGYEGAPASLFIFDSKGGMILNIEKWAGETIDVSSLSPGLYFVTINKTTLKFIKK